MDASRFLPRLSPATVPGAEPRPLDVNSSGGGGAPAASAGTAVERDEGDCVGGARGPVTAPSFLGPQVPAPRFIVVAVGPCSSDEGARPQLTVVPSQSLSVDLNVVQAAKALPSPRNSWVWAGTEVPNTQLSKSYSSLLLFNR